MSYDMHNLKYENDIFLSHMCVMIQVQTTKYFYLFFIYIYIYMCFSLTHMLYKILLLPFINISNQK